MCSRNIHMASLSTRKTTQPCMSLACRAKSMRRNMTTSWSTCTPCLSPKIASHGPRRKEGNELLTSLCKKLAMLPIQAFRVMFPTSIKASCSISVMMSRGNVSLIKEWTKSRLLSSGKTNIVSPQKKPENSWRTATMRSQPFSLTSTAASRRDSTSTHGTERATSSPTISLNAAAAHPIPIFKSSVMVSRCNSVKLSTVILQRRETSQDAVFRDWFGDKPHPCCRRAVADTLLNVGSYQGDVRSGMVVLQLRGQRQTIHAGHVQINSHESHGLGGGLLQGFLAIAGLNNAPIRMSLCNKSPDHHTRQTGVIDNEHSRDTRHTGLLE